MLARALGGSAPAADLSAVANRVARIPWWERRALDAAVRLFTGPERESLRACHAPGCVLYFVKSHPRREWCSVACGNRVRAARHYQRARGHQAD